jgi:chemotaxis protein MotB
MAGDAKKLQPIIVKKIKKGGHGHHGGAWKIAYADFVTAMMAFFLLMWLLGSTTEGDKKGIADYFGTPLKVALLSSGSGSGDSSHVIKGGGEDLTRSTGQVKRGELEAERAAVNIKALKEEQRRAEVQRLEQLKQQIEAKIDASAVLARMKGRIRIELTRDGLRITILDEDKEPMFDSGSAEPRSDMRLLLRELGSVLARVPNRLTLEGHTDAAPFAGGERFYSNWELSADRANASRRELIEGGLPADRMLRVQGLAASQPLVTADPLAPANRRISIVVMNRDAEDRVFRDAPEVEAAIVGRAEAGGTSGARAAAPGERADGAPQASLVKPGAPSIPGFAPPHIVNSSPPGGGR